MYYQSKKNSDYSLFFLLEAGWCLMLFTVKCENRQELHLMEDF